MLALGSRSGASGAWEEEGDGASSPAHTGHLSALAPQTCLGMASRVILRPWTSCFKPVALHVFPLMLTVSPPPHT